MGMKQQHGPRVDELHVDRRIRRILAFEIIFVVILYVIVFTASSVFLGQQNKANDRIQSRFQLIVDVQTIEQLILLNTNLVQAYRAQPSETSFDALKKNHTQFTELINGTQERLDALSPEEAAELQKEKKLSEQLTQSYLKIVSSSNALLGREVLSAIAAYKFNSDANTKLPTVTSDKTPEALLAAMNTDSTEAVALADQWGELAHNDITRLQKEHQLSQRYYGGILIIQGLLVIGGVLFLSYKFVLPAFEKILKQVIVQNEKLIKSDTMKTEFLSIASHQLRTPLSVIKWSMSLLLKPEQKLSKDQQELMTQAKASAETVIKLVGNLLNLSRIEQGRLAYHPVLTDVAPIIQTIVKEVQIMAKVKNVIVSAELPSEKVELIVDPLLFKEVIQNLVDNAIAYNRQNGTVRVIARDKDKNWYFDVADTGMGIMPEDLKNLFTKFYRGMNARSVRPDGSGLGLYFIQKIADLHGGKIKVESEPNQGTIFTVVIPKHPPQSHLHPDEAAGPVTEMAVSGDQAMPTPTPAPTLAPAPLVAPPAAPPMILPAPTSAPQPET
jgi:signal transduction histidine kinase